MRVLVDTNVFLDVLLDRSGLAQGSGRLLHIQAAARLALAGGPLRTLDGLHLATALVSQCRQIATTDQRLAEAARHNGLEVLPGAGHP